MGIFARNKLIAQQTAKTLTKLSFFSELLFEKEIPKTSHPELLRIHVSP